jgi:hypothetical protein
MRDEKYRVHRLSVRKGQLTGEGGCDEEFRWSLARRAESVV